MPAQGAEQHVAGLSVLVDGQALDPQYANALIEVKVVDSLKLPDVALVRLADPKGEHVDDHPLQLGKTLAIKTSAIGDRSTTQVFEGQIAAVEPDFTREGCIIAVRAYDKSHKLNRERKTRTFQQQSASDMIRKVAQEAGLSTGTVTSTSVVHEFFQQSNETDWDFGWRLALMHDFELVVEGDKMHFRAANGAGGSPTRLKWQEGLLSFRPRMSGVAQPTSVTVRAWDPASKQVVNGSASSGTTTSTAGTPRSTVASALGGGSTLVADRPAATTSEANAIAQSTLDRMADSFFEADGVALGNPQIKAGTKVQIQGVGTKFSGTYTVTSSTHSYRGRTGYQTSFQISGRSSRTLLELVRPPVQRDWSSSLVVGVVTNNNDPQQMGRVRVKYPSLSDSEESAWARIATPSSGNARGMLMLPQVDEEVVVGFEQGDTRRPVVLGSVFNGKDKPGDELLQNRDGSLGVVSDEKVHMHSKKDFEIKSDQNMTVEIQQDVSEKVQGKITSQATGDASHKGQNVTLEAVTSMSIKGVSITVEASGSLTLKGATVDIQGQGPVNVKGAIINLG